MAKRASARDIRRDVSGILRAPRRMPVADAVSTYMRVPMGAGNSVPWDPDLAPYVIEPMNCLASREYDAVVFVGPARTGKTIGLIDGWIVYNIVCDPADMLVIQVSEEKAREHSKKRLDRTFRCSPEVKTRLSPRRNDNNVYDRTFRAGNYLKLGWPSVNIMSSSDYKSVALTDYDRFPEDIDGEGDAFSLASKRTTTFMSSGMTLVESSPGRDIRDTKWRRSTPHEAPPTTGILSLYNRGDRRRLYWPCPHCGEYFQPEMDNMTGYRDSSDPVLASEAAFLQCPACKGRITPDMKRALNMKCVWLRDGQTIDRKGLVTWDEWDFDKWIWTVPKEHSKNGEEIIRPVPQKMRQWVVNLHEETKRSGYILGEFKSDSTVSTMGCTNFTSLKHEKRWSLHDLRRTFSTSLNDMGVDFIVVEQLLGHTIKGVAGIYNRSKYIPQKQEALDRWVDYLDGLVGEENTVKVIKKRSA